jgi:hypothetical protein
MLHTGARLPQSASLEHGTQAPIPLHTVPPLSEQGVFAGGSDTVHTWLGAHTGTTHLPRITGQSAAVTHPPPVPDALDEVLDVAPPVPAALDVAPPVPDVLVIVPPVPEALAVAPPVPDAVAPLDAVAPPPVPLSS